MGRAPCCDKVGLKKGPWTPEEDQKLLDYIQQHGHGSWRAVPINAGLLRCGKSCRLRWTNYLRPDIKRGKFSLQEEQTIVQLHALLGNRWSAIATYLDKRTDNEIKNYWNTHLKKKLIKMGIDPVTHKPRVDCLGGEGPSKECTVMSHKAQWESARLEAEARLAREAKLFKAKTASSSSSCSFSSPLLFSTINPFKQHREMYFNLAPLALSVIDSSPASTLSLENGISDNNNSSFFSSCDPALSQCRAEAEASVCSKRDAGAYNLLLELQDYTYEEELALGEESSSEYWSSIFDMVNSPDDASNSNRAIDTIPISIS
eukprot:TRINITY_DN2214_c0_g2_i4.p1 TRINITY_DN2214_c0_g2~~TRINITY_DN2214_c0_g2_i4.p1  ORF type:complete len:317 (+),score=13.75 TRINITY_DN2214_c0_g2_i4:367-1317(+)